jgi:hypothetical protein
MKASEKFFRNSSILGRRYVNWLRTITGTITDSFLRILSLRRISSYFDFVFSTKVLIILKSTFFVIR